MTHLPPSARARFIGLIQRLRCAAGWHRRRGGSIEFIPQSSTKRGFLGEPIKVPAGHIMLSCERCACCGQRWERVVMALNAEGEIEPMVWWHPFP
jgi:hypothetical protein